MSAVVEAGRLAAIDLGKTLTIADTRLLGGTTAPIRSIQHHGTTVVVGLDDQAMPYRVLDPHTLVTITGKEA